VRNSLGVHYQTTGDTKSIPVHTEIRFYGRSGKLKYLSDIVVLDPSDLSTQVGGSVKIHSKGFSFDKYYAIIEIKLQRTKNKKNLLIELDKDINRVKEISKETQPIHQTKFYFIYLDRAEDIEGEIKEYFADKQLDDKYELLYKGRKHSR